MQLQKINHRSSHVVIRISDPMAYIYNILLGKITKVSGYQGAVTIRLERNFSENIPMMESVFLEIEGRPVPFFISDTEYSGADILKLTFTGFDSNEKVAEFVGCRVFLTTNQSDIKKSDDLQDILNYYVYNQEKTLLGTVSDIIQNPGQLLLIIKTAGKKEILIPLHEDFIISFDKKRKTIIMEIPDGLTEIN
jgi:16S rRNA processing protein RimM